MTTEDVTAICALLARTGVRAWGGGGWGIDALLGAQTRPHKDLDLFVSLGNLAAMLPALAARGFLLKTLWEENRWVTYPVAVPLIARDAESGEVATAFVLRDAADRELDFHVFTFDGRGDRVPAWECDEAFLPDSAFAGRGTIAGTPVDCLSADWQMHTHTGYALQENDKHDLRRLHECFCVAYPAEHAGVFSL